LSYVEGDIKSIADFRELEAHYIEKNVDYIKSKMRGKEIAKEKEKDLFDQWIFLQVKCDSDVYPEDKECGLEEYLVFVDIYPSGDKHTRLVNKEFRKNILPLLISDDKIRTIELCGDYQNGDQSYDGSYIIHLVGTLGDVRNIILNSIHGTATSIDIRCRTFVVPAAEPLSSDKHVYLSETIIRNPQLQSFVSDMIPYMKFVDPTNPFIIKQVPIEVIDKLSGIYSSYKKFVKGDPRRNELLSKFNNFIYGICFGCKDQKNMNIDIHTRLKSYCSETYLSVTDKIENQLAKLRTSISDSIETIEEVDKDRYSSIKIGKDKLLKDVMESDQTIFGDLLAAIRIWNEKFIPNTESYVMELKSLENVVTYRNVFSHSYRRRLDKYNTFQFSIELMDALIDALMYEERYCKE